MSGKLSKISQSHEPVVSKGSIWTLSPKPVLLTLSRWGRANPPSWGPGGVPFTKSLGCVSVHLIHSKGTHSRWASEMKRRAYNVWCESLTQWAQSTQKLISSVELLNDKMPYEIIYRIPPDFPILWSLKLLELLSGPAWERWDHEILGSFHSCPSRVGSLPLGYFLWRQVQVHLIQEIFLNLPADMTVHSLSSKGHSCWHLFPYYITQFPSWHTFFLQRL